MPAHWPCKQAGKDKPLAISPRNWLGNNELAPDQFEAALGVKNHLEMGTFQPHGFLIGKQFGFPYSWFMDGGKWIYTETDASGTGTLSAATATLPPFWTITTPSNAQHDSGQIQAATGATLGSTTQTAWAPFIAKAGYNIVFRSRFRVPTSITNQAFAIGLHAVDTTMFASSAFDNNTQFIGLLKAGGAATCVGHLRAGAGTTSTSSLATLTFDTWYDFGFRVNGRTSVDFYFNGTKTTQPTVTNLPANTQTLCPSWVIASSAGAAALAMDMQCLVAWQEAI